MKKSIYSIILLGILSSCYYDKEENLYPAPNCSSIKDVSFKTDLKPILAASCDACHDEKNANALGGGIKIETYSQLKASVSENSLISSLKQDGKASAMPKGANKLSACEIAAFETWVFEGMKDN